MEARIKENKITLPIGTLISFKMIGKNRNKIHVKLMDSENASKFFAIFSENNVDFVIEVDNSQSIYGIGYMLTINDNYYDYYLGPGETWVMETLYSKGQKLHFISQETQEGEVILAKTAAKMNINIEEVANICSKIVFDFEVEKIAEKPPPPPPVQQMFGGVQPMSLSARSLGPPKSLSAKRSLGSNSGTTFGSLSSTQTSGTSLSAFSFGVIPDGISQTSERSYQPQAQSLAKPIPTPSMTFGYNQDNNVCDGNKSGTTNIYDNKGEKGVICFGEQSNQIYSTYSGFVKDRNLIIKPFTVEMRISVEN